MRGLLTGLLFTAGLGLAQAAGGHSATLTYLDGVNPPSTTSYNMYRITGACPAAAPTAVTPAGFALLGNSATLTQTDTTVVAGTTYCYLVSATAPGTTESINNPMAPTTIPTTLPATPPHGLVVTSK